MEKGIEIKYQKALNATSGTLDYRTGNRELTKTSEQGRDRQSYGPRIDIRVAKENLETFKKIEIKTHRNSLVSVISVKTIFQSQAKEFK